MFNQCLLPKLDYDNLFPPPYYFSYFLRYNLMQRTWTMGPTLHNHQPICSNFKRMPL